MYIIYIYINIIVFIKLKSIVKVHSEPSMISASSDFTSRHLYFAKFDKMVIEIKNSNLSSNDISWLILFVIVQ